MARPTTRRIIVRGGDLTCVHHYMMDRPAWVMGSHYFYEHGVCKKCGAITEYLRPDYPEFEETIILASGEDLPEEIPNVGHEEDMAESD